MKGKRLGHFCGSHETMTNLVSFFLLLLFKLCTFSCCWDSSGKYFRICLCVCFFSVSMKISCQKWFISVALAICNNCNDSNKQRQSLAISIQPIHHCTLLTWFFFSLFFVYHRKLDWNITLKCFKSSRNKKPIAKKINNKHTYTHSYQWRQICFFSYCILYNLLNHFFKW